MSKLGWRGWVSECQILLYCCLFWGMMMHDNVWNKGSNTWTNDKTYALTNLHSFRGRLYCQCFTNELLTNLQKKTKKKSAIQRQAHMHTKSFIVVWFCFVTPPGLELQNKGPTSKTSTWSYQKINDFVTYTFQWMYVNGYSYVTMTFPNNSVIAASGWSKQNIYLSN